LKAGIMLIAWLFLAPLGMILARYYKFVFPHTKICNLKIWFVLHRPLMLLAYVVTVCSILIIFADKDWLWINTTNLNAFVHSIIGMTVLGLATLQVSVREFVNWFIIE
jgi:hypothetical protein